MHLLGDTALGLPNDPESAQNPSEYNERDDAAPKALRHEANDDGNDETGGAGTGVDVLFSSHVGLASRCLTILIIAR